VHQLVEHDTEKFKSLSQAAFDKFDVDGDGYITSDELRMVYFYRELPNFIVHLTFLDCCIMQVSNYLRSSSILLTYCLISTEYRTEGFY
jgi:hypothetical protein